MADQLPQLPLTALRDEFIQSLEAVATLLLEAEPGAGKSTLAPLWALQWAPKGRQVWLIQPRVLPAIALARRLAELTGGAVGEQVGYQVPFDRTVSGSTRLLVMTPGVFLQRLLADPELSSVAAVMLDEIHERSVNQDTAWALAQESAILRDDLKLVLMSATPDSALRQQVEASLYSPGRCYEVALAYCAGKTVNGRPEPLSDHLVRALDGVADWHTQTVLVFLPGWREIERCRQALTQAWPQTTVLALHSRVERVEQLAALDPVTGPRVILATNIAETSLTIADVTLVLDAGLAREPDFEQRTGVTRLKTRRISAASAEQRRGRAGRVQAGKCVRLWAESEPLAPQTLPEIRRTDYLPLALRLAHWGTPADQLPWLEAPGALAMAHAKAQLQRWQLLDKRGGITSLGRQVSALGTHPRIAALLLHSRDYLDRNGWLLTLALALHFDLELSGDLAGWINASADLAARDRRWRQLLSRWQKVLDCPVNPGSQLSQLSPQLAERLARVFADRIGRATREGQYRLNTGVSVALACRSDWALVFHLAAKGSALEGVGLEVTLTDAQLHVLAEVETAIEPVGSGNRRRWVEVTRYRMGGQVVDEQSRTLAASEAPEAILRYVRERGLKNLPWSTDALQLLARARLAGRFGAVAAPDLELFVLSDTLAQWLGGFVDGETDIDALPFAEALRFYLGYELCAELDRLLPAQLTLPSGRDLRVDYTAGLNKEEFLVQLEPPEPVIRAKLQEFFGAREFGLPLSAVSLAIELLSPAGQPLAVTRDLAYFWAEVYPQVRREMRGRYVKHPWPEDPLTHVATGLTKRRLSQ